MISLPGAFKEKMKELLEADYENYINCFEEPRHFGLRVNTSKISVEDFQKIAPWPLEPIEWIPNGFYYDGTNVSPAKHPYYYAGLYYLQEPSAMTPADRLFVEEGDRVLDLCAAPGGKATELGARLSGSGLLVANDISHSRAKGLLKNLELFGIGNVLVTSEEPGKLTEYFPEYFDKILIDAPCSGEGMFRKERRMVKAWEEHGPQFFSKLQRSILTQAADMLRPGGMLLYSTCTFDPLENERAVEYLLTCHPEFKICDMKGYAGFSKGMPRFTESGSPAFEKTVRIFPHRMRGEGHYLALLKKGGCFAWDGEKSDQNPDVEFDRNDGRAGKGKAGTGLSYMGRKGVPEELAAFLEGVSWNMDERQVKIYDGRAYCMPKDLPDLKGIRFLRSGLLLGEIKKNRFEPSQALAMCLKKEEYAHVLDFPLRDERAVRYLKGETLNVEDMTSPTEKGWYLVCVDGYPLGFGKLAGQVLKNKYLPGWRWT